MAAAIGGGCCCCPAGGGGGTCIKGEVATGIGGGGTCIEGEAATGIGGGGGLTGGGMAGGLLVGEGDASGGEGEEGGGVASSDVKWKSPTVFFFMRSALLFLWLFLLMEDLLSGASSSTLFPSSDAVV